MEIEEFINNADIGQIIIYVENLINRNRTLEKEIKLMKSVNLEDNYIPKSKVREKIEELKEILNKGLKENEGYYTDATIVYDEQIQVLEELLQEGDDK